MGGQHGASNGEWEIFISVSDRLRWRKVVCESFWYVKAR